MSNDESRLRKKQYMKRWKAKNKKRVKAYQKRWHKRNRLHVLAYANRKYWENPDKARAYKRLDYSRHKYRRNKERRRMYRNDPEYRARISANSKAYYRANVVRSLSRARAWYDDKRYDGLREKALRRAGYRCEECGCESTSKWKLNTHHKDGNQSRNVMSNLEVLCPSCHWYRHH